MVNIFLSYTNWLFRFLILDLVRLAFTNTTIRPKNDFNFAFKWMKMKNVIVFAQKSNHQQVGKVFHFLCCKACVNNFCAFLILAIANKNNYVSIASNSKHLKVDQYQARHILSTWYCDLYEMQNNFRIIKNYSLLSNFDIFTSHFAEWLRFMKKNP